MRRYHSENTAAAACQRRGLDGAHAGLKQHIERVLPGEYGALSDIFDQYPARSGHCGTTSRGLADPNLCEKVEERLLEPALSSNRQRLGFRVEQLNVSLICSGQSD